MKKTRFFIIFIGLLCLFPLILPGCDYGGGNGEFFIKIDSINFPQPVVHSYDSLKVAFWGDVTKTNSRGHFLRFDITQKTDTCIISAIGYWCQGARGLPPDCAYGAQILSGIVCGVFPVQQGLYTVIVVQPDRSTLTKQIVIQ